MPRDRADTSAEVDRPKVVKTDITPLNAEQVGKLLKSSIDDRLEAINGLAVTTGMRLRELFDLQWADVDLKGRAIMLRHSLLELNGTLTLSEPKAAKGRRRIDLPQMAVDALVRHKGRMMKESLAGSERVFCNLTGGPMRRSGAGSLPVSFASQRRHRLGLSGTTVRQSSVAISVR